jgi:hypothetical protein
MAACCAGEKKIPPDALLGHGSATMTAMNRDEPIPQVDDGVKPGQTEAKH